jgi:hypothetical protein
MAKSLRQVSTKCKQCGVVFDEHNPKQPKRAMCVQCYLQEGIENRIKKAKYDKENRFGMNRVEKYKDYKMSVREPFWRQINKEIRLCKSRDEIRAFISKQMDRILGDQQLMDYINDTNIIEKTK